MHAEFTYGNYTYIINEEFKGKISEIKPSVDLRRVGSLGVKLGMTTMWNRWGHVVPVTVIELDRVQVVQIKEPNPNNHFYQVQMGIGEKNYKRLTKSLLGHYVKSNVPPKAKLSEFRVSKECLLPVGYMMGSRHYTPGMFVDVVGKTVGHGFQGTIKKHGFRRQPASHGNSLTTRVLGSTGGRQDPGRVFKLKKMYGQMGNRITTQTGLQVFKIDVDRNLLFLKGSVPGKAGTIVKIRDTLNLDKLEKNLELVHYPTFVEQPGVKYARQFSMYCGERDPDEIEVHDNAYILDDENEDASAAETKDTLPED